MVFVYHFEDHPEYGERVGNFFRSVEDGHSRIVASVLALSEILVLPKRVGRQDLVDRYRS